MTIQIDPEFEHQIPPLKDEEYQQLEKNILEDGVILNPLILWNGVLVDGHNRYRIAEKHPHIRYTTVEKAFPKRNPPNPACIAERGMTRTVTSWLPRQKTAILFPK